MTWKPLHLNATNNDTATVAAANAFICPHKRQWRIYSARIEVTPESCAASRYPTIQIRDSGNDIIHEISAGVAVAASDTGKAFEFGDYHQTDTTFSGPDSVVVRVTMPPFYVQGGWNINVSLENAKSDDVMEIHITGEQEPVLTNRVA